MEFYHPEGHPCIWIGSTASTFGDSAPKDIGMCIVLDPTAEDVPVALVKLEYDNSLGDNVMPN